MQIKLSATFTDAGTAVAFPAVLGLTIHSAPHVDMAVESTFYANPSVPQYAHESIPALASFGGVVPEGYGAGTVELSALRSSGEGGEYIPPEQVYGYAVVPPLISAGYAVTVSIATGSAAVPSLKGVGGEGSYGFGHSTMGSIFSIAVEGTGDHYGSCVERAVILDANRGIREHIVFINEHGQIVDTVSGTKELIASILEELSASGTASAIGNFLISMSEEVVVSSPYSGQVAGQPDLDSTARVWVVNVDTSASSQYDDYGFNSFFESEGKYYGVADDGIYELDGDTDNGIAIEALVDTGRSDLGTSHEKRVANVYVGVSSEGKVVLKVDADEQVYYYEARSSSEALKNHRVDVGKGLRGNYYNFTLLNQNGDDFEHETITFEPVVLSRKI